MVNSDDPDEPSSSSTREQLQQEFLTKYDETWGKADQKRREMFHFLLYLRMEPRKDLHRG